MNFINRIKKLLYDENYYEGFEKEFLNIDVCLMPWNIKIPKVHEARDNLMKKFLKNLVFTVNCLLLCLAIGLYVYILYNAVADSDKTLTVVELSSTLSYLSYTFLAAVKVMTIFTNNSEFGDVIERLRKIYPKSASEVDKSIFSSTIGLAMTISKWIWYSSIVTDVVFFSIPLYYIAIDWWTIGEIGKMTFPFHLYYPFDTQSVTIYAFVYMYEVWFAILDVGGKLAGDRLFYILVSHICLQLKMLTRDLQQVFAESVSDKTTSFSITEKGRDLQAEVEVEQFDHNKTYEKFSKLIKRHQEIIRLANVLDECFAVMILLDFIVTSIVLCVCLMNVMSVDASHLFVFVSYLVIAMFEVLMLCLFGNALTDASFDLGVSIFNSQWYKSKDKRIRNATLYILARAQQPLKMTGYKFFVVDLTSFSSILSTSWSYFTLLRRVYEN